MKISFLDHMRVHRIILLVYIFKTNRSACRRQSDSWTLSERHDRQMQAIFSQSFDFPLYSVAWQDKPRLLYIHSMKRSKNLSVFIVQTLLCGTHVISIFPYRWCEKHVTWACVCDTKLKFTPRDLQCSLGASVRSWVHRTQTRTQRTQFSTVRNKISEMEWSLLRKMKMKIRDAREEWSSTDSTACSVLIPNISSDSGRRVGSDTKEIIWRQRTAKSPRSLRSVSRGVVVGICLFRNWRVSLLIWICMQYVYYGSTYFIYLGFGFVFIFRSTGFWFLFSTAATRELI